MNAVSGRVLVNLVWLVLASVAVVIGAFLSYASGVLFDDSYVVSVQMPEAGGVLPEQEVTVLGRAVGQVEDVTLNREGVLVELSVRGEESVPARGVVQVLRRSPIGEQAVDLRPLEVPWAPAEPDSMIDATEIIVPAEIPFLLDRTVQLFGSIEVEDVEVVVEELALALDGRGPALRQLGRDTLDLQRTLVGGIPTLERLTEESAPLLDTLNESRDDLAGTFADAASLLELLEDQQTNLESLVAVSPTALDETATLIRDQSANLQCLVSDLTDLNELVLGPSTYTGPNEGQYSSKLDELDSLLQRNRFFFQEGFNLIVQPEYATGLYWNRVDLLLTQVGLGEAYPEKRPTPAIFPGAACESDEFGVGVNAVRQADAQPAFTDSPGIMYAPLVEGGRDGGNVPPPGDGGPLAGPDGSVLPATGGGLLAAVPLLLGLGLALRGRR